MAIRTAPEAPSKGAGESVLEKLKALDAQRAELVEGAKREALALVEKAVADLNSLGFHYSLIEEGESEPRKALTRPKPERGEAKRQTKDAPCSICHFKTAPPHDARSHRGQKEKRPFTVEELMEKGLSKVG